MNFSAGGKKMYENDTVSNKYLDSDLKLDLNLNKAINHLYTFTSLVKKQS